MVLTVKAEEEKGEKGVRGFCRAEETREARQDISGKGDAYLGR